MKTSTNFTKNEFAALLVEFYNCEEELNEACNEFDTLNEELEALENGEIDETSYEQDFIELCDESLSLDNFDAVRVFKELDYTLYIIDFQEYLEEHGYDVNLLPMDNEEITEEFENYIEEGYSAILSHHFSASRVLRECDPIMYREELFNYAEACFQDNAEEMKADLVDKVALLEERIEELKTLRRELKAKINTAKDAK